MTGGYENHLSNTRWQGGAEDAALGAERSLPGLHEEERLPWLDASEDELYGTGVDPARVWAFVLAGLALLILIVAGVWWTTHPRENTQLADGSIIAAPPGPIKVAPQDPGGKTFDGTGDSSFTVSQGHSPGATLANGGDGADNTPAMGAIADTANPVEAIGVQVGAFSTQQAAQGAWDHLAKTYEALSGAAHRIVEGKADIGTVYRLQAVAGSVDAATALCERLKTAGLNCQVKD